MLKSIDYCFRNKIVASFYCNGGGKCEVLVGYIERYNDDEILIAHISSHGNYDGFILKHLADIYRIEYAGKYEKKIEKLYPCSFTVSIRLKYTKNKKRQKVFQPLIFDIRFFICYNPFAKKNI